MSDLYRCKRCGELKGKAEIYVVDRWSAYCEECVDMPDEPHPYSEEQAQAAAEAREDR